MGGGSSISFGQGTVGEISPPLLDRGYHRKRTNMGQGKGGSASIGYGYWGKTGSYLSDGDSRGKSSISIGQGATRKTSVSVR